MFDNILKIYFLLYVFISRKGQHAGKRGLYAVHSIILNVITSPKTMFCVPDVIHSNSAYILMNISEYGDYRYSSIISLSTHVRYINNDY